MSKSLKELKMTLQSRHLSILNIYRFTSSRPFEEAYAVATDEERLIAEQFINNGNKAKLVEWVKILLRKHHLIEVLDVRYLRNLGQEMGVKNYATLTRLSLIAAIHKLEEQNGKSVDVEGDYSVKGGNVSVIDACRNQ